MVFSSRQLISFGRKRSERWWFVRLQGHSKFCSSRGLRERSRANNCSPWFCPICGAKALCGKEAFLLKAFWLLCGYKVTGPPAAKSGYSPGKASLYSLEIINVVFVLIGINELPLVGCLRSSQ